jgi:hypothetical protein
MLQAEFFPLILHMYSKPFNSSRIMAILVEIYCAKNSILARIGKDINKTFKNARPNRD